MDHDYERYPNHYGNDDFDATLTNFDTTSTYSDNDNDDPIGPSRDQFDILSFMSVITKVEAHTAKEWAPYALLSIHLGPWNSFLPYPPYRGNSFAVTLIPKKRLLGLTLVGLDDGPPGPILPRLLAVKTPLLEKGDDKKKKNSHLFRSISKEYQILRSELLRRDGNVINAYGCCWQSLDVYDGLPIPCLILEGTELGDLANFCQTHELTLRERLRMCIQVTTGLQAIHAIGVIHGDLKPQNILVFRSKSGGYSAKIADFGEAVVLQENEPPFRRPTGTVLYYAPECYNPAAIFDERGLFKAEIFSLGIVLSSLIQGMHILEEMKNRDDLEYLKKDDGLVSWLASLSWEGRESAPFDKGTESIGSTISWVTDPGWSKNSPLADEQLWAAFLSLLNRTLAASPIQRFNSIEELLALLRNMLRLNLRKTLLYQKDASEIILGQSELESPWSARGSAQWSAQMGKLLSIPISVPKAKLRKATGNDIPISSRLDREEVQAILLSCLMRHNQPNFNREFRFVEKYTTGRERKPHLTKRRLRLFQPYHRRREPWRMREREAHNAMVFRYRKIEFDWLERYLLLTTQAALKLAEKDSAIFKITNDSKLFRLLPHSAKELLENALLQDATSVSNNSSRHAEAAFEYTSMVLNSGRLSPERLGTALSLLTMSAQRGHVVARSTFGRLHSISNLPSPVSSEIEIEWLRAAVCQGSLTARERLQAIDPPLTSSNTRRIPYSCLHPEAEREFKEDIQHRIYSPDNTKVWHAVVQDFASTGDTEGFLYLTNCMPGDYNIQNVFGETPLVVACRGGHSAMVALLLQHNADPRIATKLGVTALHFLSAFDDEDIPRIAALLLEHGAELEKQSEQASMYKSTFDSPFGTTGGTPLLWAVLAGNSCATQILADAGADPFTEEIYPTDTGFRGSPMMWAAALHQFQLLKIMLASSAQTTRQQIELKQCLNTTAQHILSLAIDTNPGFKMREYLIHGEDIERNALRCVQILIEYGADPTVYSHIPGGSHSYLVNLAAFSGNKSILEFWWDYNDGLLRPTPEKWTSALQTAIFKRHHSAFDFLIAHRDDITASVRADINVVKTCLTLTTDKYFVLGCVRLMLQSEATVNPKRLVNIFFMAIATNNFEAAKLLFEHGVDLTARLEPGQNTILGELIASSSAYPNIEEKVSFLLSLQENPDTLFWNVTYLDSNGLTALQAIVSTTRNRAMMNSRVFDIILKKFEEKRYLNAKIKGLASEDYTGWTALHLAAYYGNFEAVKWLSQEHGIHLSRRSSHNETPADICIDRELQFAKRMAWQSLSQDVVDHEERSRNLGILRHLLSERGRVSKYSDIVRILVPSSTDEMDRALEAVKYLCLKAEQEESSRANLSDMCLQGDPTGALRKGGYLPAGW